MLFKLSARQSWALANEINSRPTLKSVSVGPLDGEPGAAEAVFESEGGHGQRTLECFRVGPRGSVRRIRLLKEARR